VNKIQNLNINAKSENKSNLNKYQKCELTSKSKQKNSNMIFFKIKYEENLTKAKTVKLGKIEKTMLRKPKKRL
jgi:hypothetical protein